jgi:hypothetical protein
MPAMRVLADQVIELKRFDLTGVNMVTNWLTRRVVLLKKHPGWEYCGVQDPTHKLNQNIELAKLT